MEIAQVILLSLRKRIRKPWVAWINRDPIVERNLGDDVIALQAHNETLQLGIADGEIRCYYRNETPIRVFDLTHPNSLKRFFKYVQRLQRALDHMHPREVVIATDGPPYALTELRPQTETPWYNTRLSQPKSKKK